MKMEIRNVKLVTDTEAVMEINHPELGWIPYTAVKDSGEEKMEQLFQAALKKKPDYDISYMKNRIISNAQFVRNPALNEYTPEEISSFSMKRIEAEKILKGERSDLIEKEAALKETTAGDLATKIVDKNNDAALFEVRKRIEVDRIQSDLSTIDTYENLLAYAEKLNNG